LPEVKEKDAPEYVVVKKVKGFGTGYFGPQRRDYPNRKEYQRAIELNGKGEETKSGTRPRIGTIAADTRFYPLGTIIFIPEINLMATVEDVGSKVKGKKHIDVFCGHGKKAQLIANTWGNGTPITLIVMRKKVA
jgi:3D (Asp-Asp-Asp) domain-containing protein